MEYVNLLGAGVAPEKDARVPKGPLHSYSGCPYCQPTNEEEREIAKKGNKFSPTKMFLRQNIEALWDMASVIQKGKEAISDGANARIYEEVVIVDNVPHVSKPRIANNYKEFRDFWMNIFGSFRNSEKYYKMYEAERDYYLSGIV